VTLYAWLKFFHLAGLTLFLFAHGVSAGASLALRGTVSAQTRQLLVISQRSVTFYYPGLLVVVITGVWMGFIGSYWSRGWVWAAIVILVLTIGAMRRSRGRTTRLATRPESPTRSWDMRSARHDRYCSRGSAPRLCCCSWG
jgi:hypothetical protein